MSGATHQTNVGTWLGLLVWLHSHYIQASVEPSGKKKHFGKLQPSQLTALQSAMQNKASIKGLQPAAVPSRLPSACSIRGLRGGVALTDVLCDICLPRNSAMALFAQQQISPSRAPAVLAGMRSQALPQPQGWRQPPPCGAAGTHGSPKDIPAPRAGATPWVPRNPPSHCL